jgi:hypothetical protein
MDGLKIYFRQHQLQDSANGNANVIVDCTSPAALYVPGNVPKPNWLEVTDFTTGLEKLSLSWDKTNQGGSDVATNETGSNYDKGLSLDLIFDGIAFEYIWDWLLTQSCQIINAIDVKIYDVICKKTYRLFEIKADNLKYKPNDKCRIEVKLREQDLTWHNIHKTLIWDNHQNWFNQTGTSTKSHPTFLTCIEPRPRLISSVRVAFSIFYHSFPAINLLDDVGITFGFPPLGEDLRRILEINNFVPAPLIRDYIDNVAAKLGMQVDTIFHRVGTPEYNACIFHTEGGQMYENDGDNEISPSTAFIFENRWSVTLPELLDKLKKVYSAEWYVTPNNTIVFKPTIELVNLAAIIDFTTGQFSIEDLEYTFDGNKKAAYGKYNYQVDGSDLGSQEIANLYNDVVDYDGPANNPMLEGSKNKQFEFAPTSFVRDGRAKDYIRLLINDGEKGAYVLMIILVLVVASLVGGVLTVTGSIIAAVAMAAWIIAIANKSDDNRDYYTDENGSYTGAVRLVTANQTLTPRILIWDGVSRERAKVIKFQNIPTNPYYNPSGTTYSTNNSIGIDNPSLNVFNYYAYFDSKYRDNLYDRFHDLTDNPLKSLETNQSFIFTTDLCCEMLDLLGAWENDFVKIGYIIKLEKRANYDVYGRIEHIDSSYQDFSIKIKGKVIKK